jgi:hypothetical protein
LPYWELRPWDRPFIERLLLIRWMKRVAAYERTTSGTYKYVCPKIIFSI